MSITGVVTDALSGAALAGALVEITQGPPEFENERSILSEDPSWAVKTERIDRTLSRVDGAYYFLDLPSGSYHLQISLPQAGRRYGNFQADGATTLGQRDTSGRIMITRIDAALIPTQIQGQVTRSDNHQPISGARVSLQGDETWVETDAAGHYNLSDLTAVKPTVAVSADQFKPFSQNLTLTPGAVQTLDISLDPV
jgi:hypothetical protein